MARFFLAALFLGASLAGRPARAQDTRTVSAERPSQDAALALLDEVWDLLPETGPVALYLSCAQPDCSGQVPAWFRRADWEAGLGEAGEYTPDQGISPERLAELRRQSPHPPALAASIAQELAALGQPVDTLLLVFPRHHGDEKLELSWQVVSLSSPGQRDPFGRLTVRLPMPPAPVLPPGPAWHTRPVVWAGAGVLAVGGTVAVLASSALLQAEPQDRHGALTTTATLGWVGVMAGSSMMIVPALTSSGDSSAALHMGLHLRR